MGIKELGAQGLPYLIDDLLSASVVRECRQKRHRHQRQPIADIPRERCGALEKLQGTHGKADGFEACGVLGDEVSGGPEADDDNTRSGAATGTGGDHG